MANSTKVKLVFDLSDAEAEADRILNMSDDEVLEDLAKEGLTLDDAKNKVLAILDKAERTVHNRRNERNAK